MSRVHVHVWRSWLSSAGRAPADCAWSPGLTLRDIVPSHLAGRDGLAVFVNGERCEDLGQRPSPGDHVDVAIMPHGAAFVAAFVKASFGARLAFSLVAITLLNSIIARLMPKRKGPKRAATA